jgi:hypothetical protein
LFKILSPVFKTEIKAKVYIIDIKQKFKNPRKKNSVVNFLTNSTGTVNWVYNTLTNQITSSASLYSLNDVYNLSNPKDGSLLIFDENINKWIATTTMDKQNVDGGSY